MTAQGGASPKCRLDRLRRSWASPDPAADPAAPDGLSGTKRLAIRWIPGERRLRGEMLLAIGEQDWLARYEAAPRPTPSTP